MAYYGCCWYPYYGWGAWGGAAIANVYGVWGNTAYSHTAAAWANPYTGNYDAATRGAYHNTKTGRSTVAGRGYNTNIYTGPLTGIAASPRTTRTLASLPEAEQDFWATFTPAKARPGAVGSLITPTRTPV